MAAEEVEGRGAWEEGFEEVEGEDEGEEISAEESGDVGAPMFPEPAFRGSMPLERPTRRPKGMEPRK